MWEVKFDNGETHKLAASWIELKLWSKSIEDEENDADDDVDEESLKTQASRRRALARTTTRTRKTGST